MQMLVRNRVEDYTRWRQVFDKDTERGLAYGISLAHMWRCTEDPNNVFFVLNIGDLEKANEFLTSPESAESGEASGVLDGEFYYVESAI